MKFVKFLIILIFLSCSSEEDTIANTLDCEYTEKNSSTPGNKDETISFVHISDTHGSQISIIPMIFTLTYSNCDFAIITGDILPTDDTINYLASSEKPILTVIGNHDAYDHLGQIGFREKVMNKMNTPDVEFGDENACYYHVNFYKEGYSLRVICIDQYEIDTEGKASKHCSVMSQKQINWFIKLLEESEDFTYVMVLIHQGFGNAKKGMRDVENINDFISIYAKNYPKGYNYMGWNNPFMIPDIVNAYLTGKDISNIQYPTGYKDGKIVVNTHFKKAHRNFIGYFGGHLHQDMVEYLPFYDAQLQVLMTFCGKGTGSRYGDLIKTENGEQSYNINYTTIDFKERKLKIKRLGANQKVDSTTRDSIEFML